MKATTEISGWFETEDGCEQFHVVGRGLKTLLMQVKADHPDFGDTEMEVENQDGDDITQQSLKVLFTQS